jgi:hypothetical protein
MNQQKSGQGERRHEEDVPEHLKRRPQLFVSRGDRIVEAPAEDLILAQGYAAWVDKGALVDGRRLTLMTAKSTYEVGEAIRVIHVVEAVGPGHSVHVAGPKEVVGEYVDEKLVTRGSPRGGDALTPQAYDGPVLPSPAVDYNYEITRYSFSAPGRHRIRWQLGPLRSNVLDLEVVDAPLPSGQAPRSGHA